MTTAELVAEIDALLDRLMKARNILATIHSSSSTGKQVRRRLNVLTEKSVPPLSEPPAESTVKDQRRLDQS